MGKRSGTTSEPLPGRGSGAAALARATRHPAWVVVAVLVLVAGMASAVVAARSVAGRDAEKSRQEFEQSSAAVASTLQLAIQHEEDLVVSAQGFVLGNPDATNTTFVQWADTVRALERYPELQGFGYVVLIPASQLGAFSARAIVDPVGPLSPDGTFQVIPAGERPFYCLGVAGQQRGLQGGVQPAGVDFCAGSGDNLTPSRDSGQSAYMPYVAGDTPSLSIEIPVYRGGVALSTVDARREAFQGWVGMVLSPKVLLDRALQGHPNTAVTFRFHQSSSNVVFTSGEAPRGAQSATTDLHNGWTVETFGTVTPGGVLGNGSSLALLLTGMALSVLLATLVLVLGTGRARALRLVDERTGELRHQALHDALTGLPNRALIMDRIEQMLARDHRNGTSGAALYIDLDEFKNVNDTLGHYAGDRLLVAVAARLQTALRDSDTIGRMGGDEFVVLIDGGDLTVGPELVAERLLDVLRKPFELESVTMPLIVSASIGLAIGDRASAGELLRDADVALYQAKAAGKNRYAIFHPEMQSEISHRIELEFDLRSALDGHQFRLVYQPIYNLHDLTVVGVEALLRWDHPTLGIVQPDDFIQILEQTGQIREVGRWVLREACEQMAAWHARGGTLDVSVNVSGRQLDGDSIVADIRDALDTSGLTATSLIIEVTETALMHNTESTARRLEAIRELGVRISVDDFGTGYSSLAYLQQFPVDCLKIDRSFTDGIITSPESRAIISTLVQLGKDLGLRTLAEGVETHGQMDYLRGQQVDEVQGFLFARPLDPHTLETQILTTARPTPQASDRA